jgi:hypothetical protein
VPHCLKIPNSWAKRDKSENYTQLKNCFFLGKGRSQRNSHPRIEAENLIFKIGFDEAFDQKRIDYINSKCNRCHQSTSGERFV